MTSLRQATLQFIHPFVRLPIIGLDISDRSMKYLKLKANSKIDFDFWGEIEIPEGVIEDEEIKDEKTLTDVFAKWADGPYKKKIVSSFAAVSLPEEKSFLRLIQIPKIKFENIANAIRWEIESNIPLSPEDVLFDYELITGSDKNYDHYDVLIIAFPKNIILPYLRVLSNIGLRVSVLELESQAIVRAVVKDFTDKNAKIIVDLGRDRASFVIFSDGEILFTSTIEIGGRKFEENIAKELNVSIAKAAEIKKTIGLNRGEYQGQVFAALVPLVSAVADELERVIQFYKSKDIHIHTTNPEVDEVILTGGDASLLGIDTYLSSILKIPVRKADVFVSMRKIMQNEIPPITYQQSLAFATAIGLALRGIR